MLELNNTLLVIIDVQEKLYQAMHEKETLAGNLQKLVKGLQILNVPIITVEQYPQGLGHTITEIKELSESWNPIEKNCFNCCQNEEFIERIKEYNRGTILLAGIEAHICVYQTAIDLMDMGYRVEIVLDAVSSRTEANKNVGIEKMIAEGSSFTTVEMALFELLKVGKGDAFKEILKIVK